MELAVGVLMIGVPYLGAAIALYFGVRFVRAFERRTLERNELQALEQRVSQLEEELQQTAAATERLEEEQRFTLKVLAERQVALPPVI
jgi:hypothetical protein